MSHKKRSSLGRSTSASRRMVAFRAAETPEQTNTWLGDQRTRQAASRAADTPEQTSTRLGDQRTRQAASRAAETPGQ